MSKIVVSAVLNPGAGDVVGRSLGSITEDLELVLFVSIYFEWARTQGQHEVLREIGGKLDAMHGEARVVTAPAMQAFLGGVDSLMLDDHEGHVALRLNRWVVQGHGVTAIW